MSHHPLDNPVWETLRTHHARFALRGDAKSLYDRLGFIDRGAIDYWQVRRAAVGTDR